MISSSVAWPISASYVDSSTPLGSSPNDEVAFACGSRSTTSTRTPTARHEPRFTAVVVLPTPPFWLAIASTRLPLTRKIVRERYGARMLCVHCCVRYEEQSAFSHQPSAGRGLKLLIANP